MRTLAILLALASVAVAKPKQATTTADVTDNHWAVFWMRDMPDADTDQAHLVVFCPKATWDAANNPGSKQGKLRKALADMYNGKRKCTKKDADKVKQNVNDGTIQLIFTDSPRKALERLGVVFKGGMYE